MMKRFLLTGLVFIYWFTAFAQPIDLKKSRVEFKVGNMGFMTVSGTISGMKGTVQFDQDNLKDAHFDVTVEPATIETNNNKRDEHLKEEDFFNVAEYLSIRFVSSEVLKTSKGFLARGELSLRGVTRNIDIPFALSQELSEVILKGKIQVDREDYALGTDKYSGAFMIGSTVEVVIICVLTQ